MSNLFRQDNGKLFTAIWKTDGLNHINVYSKGKTKLGQFLTHFAHTPFNHPHFGKFQSMEGFWYYLRCGGNDNLRCLVGFEAKKYGKTLPMKLYDNPEEFHEDILGGNYQKIIQDDKLKEAFISSHLPLLHYYTYGSEDKTVVIEPQDSIWLMEGLEEIRTALKNDEVPQCWRNSQKRYHV